MAQELKLKQKKKKKTSSSSKSKTSQKQKSESKLGKAQKVALHALQKQMQVLKLREALILAGFIGGAALLRVPMQAIPSAEPITFFALLAGWLFGWRKGFAVGAGALFASNFFVFGGQGPWTLFQALGFGLAGVFGGLMRGRKAGYLKAGIAAVLATLTFELVLNVSSLLIFPTGFLVFLTALPFTLMHLGSNFAFAMLLPKTRKFIEEKGEFNEKVVCNELINNIKSARNKLSGKE